MDKVPFVRESVCGSYRELEKSWQVVARVVLRSIPRPSPGSFDQYLCVRHRGMLEA